MFWIIFNMYYDEARHNFCYSSYGNVSVTWHVSVEEEDFIFHNTCTDTHIYTHTYVTNTMWKAVRKSLAIQVGRL